jgi:hypothetical protein
MINKADKVRSLRSSREQVARMKLGCRHVAPLTWYVEELALARALLAGAVLRSARRRHLASLHLLIRGCWTGRGSE